MSNVSRAGEDPELWKVARAEVRGAAA